MYSMMGDTEKAITYLDKTYKLIEREDNIGTNWYQVDGLAVGIYINAGKQAESRAIIKKIMDLPLKQPLDVLDAKAYLQAYKGLGHVSNHILPCLLNTVNKWIVSNNVFNQDDNSENRVLVDIAILLMDHVNRGVIGKGNNSSYNDIEKSIWQDYINGLPRSAAKESLGVIEESKSIHFQFNMKKRLLHRLDDSSNPLLEDEQNLYNQKKALELTIEQLNNAPKGALQHKFIESYRAV